MEIKKIEFYNFGPFYGSHPLEVDVEDWQTTNSNTCIKRRSKNYFHEGIQVLSVWQCKTEPVGVGTGLELDKVPNRKAALER